MFRCSTCKVSSLPRVKPVRVPSEERSRQYRFADVEGNQRVTFGRETVREAQLCPGCAGTPVPAAQIDTKNMLALGLAMQAHARKCQKKFDECFVCQRNVSLYREIPAPVINKITSDVQVHTGRISLCEATVYAMVARTKHKSKRASADFLAAFPVLKAYEQRGGKM